MCPQEVIIIGGLGNGTVIAQAIEHSRINGGCNLRVAGFMSDREAIGSSIEGFPVMGKTNATTIQDLTNKGYKFIYTVLRIDGQIERVNLFGDLGLRDDNLVSFIHPSAYVAPDVICDPGVIIMPMVMISSHAHLNRGCIVMVGSSIGHNTELGEFTHVAAQAVVGAYIKTGTGVHIGLNSTIRENLVIGDYATLGMGSVLTKNIGASEIWVGNPARFLRMAK
ncbi:MAG: hypothetical protein PHW20_07430 [Clostridia bacterium]|nr:hypothetical protein [Clostridia bacterium]